MFYSAVLIYCCVYCAVSVCSPMPEARVGKGHTRQDPSQIGGPLPIVTMPGDQTKNQVVLHVESPTKPYRILCSRCETDWGIWIGAGGLTRCYHVSVLAVCHYNIALPIITT